MSLVTSNVYLSETFGSNSANSSLYDETQMINQFNQQNQREDFVRRALRGNYSPNGSPNKYSRSTRLSDSKEAKMRYIQNRINEVREERERLVYEGEAKVREIMDQLKKEQDEFAKEEEKHKEEDKNVEEMFLKEIEELSRRFDACCKPMHEINQEVNAQMSCEQQDNSQSDSDQSYSANDYNTSTITTSQLDCSKD